MPIPMLPAGGGGGGGGSAFSPDSWTQAVTDITNLFVDQKQSGKQTTKLDPEGMKYLLTTILGSTEGLANVASMDNISGLYNSATQNLLINDLLARTSGEIAARNITTTSSSKKDAPLDGILGAVGLGSAGGGAGGIVGDIAGWNIGLATNPVGTVKKAVKKVKKFIKKIF